MYLVWKEGLENWILTGQMEGKKTEASLNERIENISERLQKRKLY